VLNINKISDRFSGNFAKKLFVYLCVSIVLAPLLLNFTAFTHIDNDIWNHLISENILWQLCKNSLILCFSVALLSLVLGVSLGAIVAFFDFPARKYFEWLFIMPLSIPAYVFAFIYVGAFEYSSPINSFFHQYFSFDLNPPKDALYFTAPVLALAFYPYVYLYSKNAFQRGMRKPLENARSLGLNPIQAFFRCLLPLARPAIAGALLLVIMESLADFGAVSIFNYDTFTTAIYKTWFSLQSINGAAQLSSALSIFAILLIYLDFQKQNRKSFASKSLVSKDQRKRFQISKFWRIMFFVYASIIILISFVFPMLQLLYWAAHHLQNIDYRYLHFLSQSAIIATVAATICVGLSFLLVLIQVRSQNTKHKFLIRLSTLGYALPGSILAVGVYSLFAKFHLTHLAFTALITGLCIRFLSVSFNQLQGARLQYSDRLSEAAQSLGKPVTQRLGLLHWPLLKNTLLTAFLLVFVDVAKEMPITLMTRPFGWSPLSVRIYEMTAEGEWQKAALPAVFLVLLSCLPILFFIFYDRKKST